MAACVDLSDTTAALFTYLKINYRFSPWFWTHILAFFFFFFKHILYYSLFKNSQNTITLIRLRLQNMYPQTAR